MKTGLWGRTPVLRPTSTSAAGPGAQDWSPAPRIIYTIWGEAGIAARNNRENGNAWGRLAPGYDQP
jgi:hypothetical protein